MILRIERGSAVPISSQIAQQISSLCAAGKLHTGERLPSVRELARKLAVNQNTILRVYERLVHEGLLEMRQGQGTFVAADARSAGLSTHRKRLVEEMRQWARQGTSLGLDADGLHELLNEAIQQMNTVALHKPEMSR